MSNGTIKVADVYVRAATHITIYRSNGDRNVADGDIPGRIATKSVTNASYGLLLLSRINGDAPVLMTARRLDDSRAGRL